MKFDHPEVPFSRVNIDVAVNSCSLECIECFTRLNKDGEYTGSHEKIRQPGNVTDIPLGDKMAIVDFTSEKVPQAAVTFTGRGDPPLDRGFWLLVGYAGSKGLKTLAYTPGININYDGALTLLKHGHVMVKKNTMNGKLQDELVGRPGASKGMQRGLEYLMKARDELYNSGEWYGELGIQSSVNKLNIKDLPDLLRYCRENELFPLIDSFITLGVDPSTVEKMAITPEELLDVYETLQEIDKNEYGIETQILPGSRTYNRRTCNNALKLGIDHRGKVFSCVSRFEDIDVIGDIYREGKSINENLSDALDVVRQKQNRQCCICSTIIPKDYNSSAPRNYCSI